MATLLRNVLSGYYRKTCLYCKRTLIWDALFANGIVLFLLAGMIMLAIYVLAELGKSLWHAL